MGLMVVHVPIAVNNFWAAMTLKDMGLVFCLYLGLIIYVNTFDKLRTLVSVWIGLHVITAVLGIASGGSGVGGWMGDENDFCMVINMVIPFAFFMIYSEPGPLNRVKYIGLLALFVFTVMVTLSRGGFIGMTAAGAYCWFRSTMKFGAIFIVILLVLFMAAVAPDKYWDEIKSSFSNEEMETGTGGDRLYIWGIGFEMFLANPLFGVGQGNFPWAFEEYEAGREFMEKSRAGRAAHSLYFTLLPEMGLVGVIVFVGMLYWNRSDIRTIERLAKAFPDKDKDGKDNRDKTTAILMGRAMEGSLIGFLVSSVFISTLWYPSVWVMMGFVVALRNIVVDRARALGVATAGIVDGAPRSGIALPKLGKNAKTV
ncbi:hypothetical protein YTPLAS18_24120 [Nitrospira sp.]|nr:hypothetical protein YTPLAS18_24120 [Nitrospira sp.]